MRRPRLEVADVFHRHGADWRRANAGHVSLGQLQVMSAIEQCRSAALGGHVERCEDCGHSRIAYNSCRNRHCPKCQGAAARTWLTEREAELLPVPYYHLVFTLPGAIADIAYHNKAAIYGLLFTAAAEATLTIAADPKRLGAKIGIWPDSRSSDLGHALELSRRVFAAYRDDVVVQPYVAGRNVRASFLGLTPQVGVEALGVAFVDSGADFQTIRPNGFTELEAKYAFELDDGAVVYIENVGIRFGPKQLLDRIAKGESVDPALIYFRSVPRFETGAEKYRWLMQSLFVASAARHADRVVVDVHQVL